MILRCVCWSIFLSLTFLLATKAQVQIDEHGYQNVLISFAPNVPEGNGRDLVNSIQELLESTSSVLNTAVGIRIGSVTFLLPSSWSKEKWENVTINPATSDQIERRPDIKVDATEQSPFGKQPFTLQHGGCGVAGHQITLPVDFVSSTEESRKDKLLAREWLKYRYGVFDENGFAGDALYPDYYRILGSSEIRITECTDSDVTYTFKKPVSGEACDMKSEAHFDSCRAHPDKELAANVTSSLMYFHEDFPNIEHICGKDDHPHHNTSRNKQNALCNGQSIWDVVKQSKDLQITQHQSDEPVPENIQFSYIQESKPRFVVLLEDSDNLLEKKEMPPPIRFALRRFYYDLPTDSKLAIYTYNNEVTAALTYTPLPAKDRNDLRVIADFGLPATSVCTSCGLKKAMEILLEKSEVEKGSILLITGSPLDAISELPEKPKDSPICLRVLRFTGEGNPDDESYKDLENSFDCFSYKALQSSSDVLQTFNSLSDFLMMDVPKVNDEIETKVIITEEMSGQNPVTIHPDAKASLYTLWFTEVIGSGSIECKTGDTPVALTPGTAATDIASFTFDRVTDDVICKFVSPKRQAVLTQVQMTSQKGQYFAFDTWIHDVSTETNQLPILIYAKIYFGGYPVKDASVTMVVTSGGNPEQIVKMLDNGRGDPDVTQYDGIYSGYFTEFVTTGEYDITVKINDNEGQAKIGKQNPASRSPTCCGSKVISEDEDAPPFEMEEHTKYIASSTKPKDGYPPSKILDLQVAFDNSSNLILSWTAPGGEKASSYEFYAFCDLEDCGNGRLPNWLKLNETEAKPKSHGESEEAVFLLTPEIPKIESLTLFFALKSRSEKGKLSDLSNKAEILLSFSSEPVTTAPPIIIEEKKLAESDTTGIIVGSTIIAVLLLFCLGAVFYLFVIKPRRSPKPSDISTNDYFQDKEQNSTEDSGSLRATHPRNRNSSSMRRVESFPVLLYTHDQLKDFKKKVDPPLYKPSIAPRPWMSMNVLSNNDLNKGGDSKSIGSASTLPMNDKHRSTEMKQLDDISVASETPISEEPIKV